MWFFSVPASVEKKDYLQLWNEMTQKQKQNRKDVKKNT